MSNLYRPGPPRADVPCIANTCTKCCYETQMPLTLGDVDRITAIGRRIEDFSVSHPDGTLRLRTVEAQACYFLDSEGRCSIHEVKPEGCRLYPFVFDEEAGRVVRDDYCPYQAAFDPPPAVESKVRELVARIEAEAKGRLASTEARRR